MFPVEWGVGDSSVPESQGEEKDLSGSLFVWSRMQTHRPRGKFCWNDLPPERSRAVWFTVPSSAWAFFRSAGTSSWLAGLTWISWNRWRRRWRVPAVTTKTRTTKWAARLKTEVSLTLPSESQMAPRASTTRQKGGRRLLPEEQKEWSFLVK